MQRAVLVITTRATACLSPFTLHHFKRRRAAPMSASCFSLAKQVNT